MTAKPERASGAATVLYDSTLGWRFPNPAMEAMFPLESMGETGENVAERYGVSRDDQDALRFAPISAGPRRRPPRFADELVPVGDFTVDEHPRPDSTAEALAKLRPAPLRRRQRHGGQFERDQRRRRCARDRE